MNKLTTKERVQILHMLVEGYSLRDAARMANVSRNTVVKLLLDAGDACLEFQDQQLQNLPCKNIQCDEIWSFVCSTQKYAPKSMEDQASEVWTWTAIDADTKLVPCWHVGGRSLDDAKSFIDDLVGRLPIREQLTTDGHRPYLEAIDNAFGNDTDHARLIKIYGSDKNPSPERRYSPGRFVEAKRGVAMGNPDVRSIGTSHVEPQKLTMRMSMKRVTPLTSDFSKKIENHMHAISLHYMYYNFCRIHKSLKATPAMEAGIAESVYDFEFIVDLIDTREPAPTKQGPYKKKISN